MLIEVYYDRVYDYTVILTYLGFSSGMIGIFLAITGNTFWAVMCLMFSGLCDMFDGRVARTKKKEQMKKDILVYN